MLFNVDPKGKEPDDNRKSDRRVEIIVYGKGCGGDAVSKAALREFERQ